MADPLKQFVTTANARADAEKFRTLAKVMAEDFDARTSAMVAVLEAYERWEADMIENNAAWTHETNVMIPPALWNRMIEIQAMRNKALGRLQ